MQPFSERESFLRIWSAAELESTLVSSGCPVFRSSRRIVFAAADMSYAKAGSYHHVPRDFNALIQTCSGNIQKITQNSKKTAANCCVLPRGTCLLFIVMPWYIIQRDDKPLHCKNIRHFNFPFYSPNTTLEDQTLPYSSLCLTTATARIIRKVFKKFLPWEREPKSLLTSVTCNAILEFITMSCRNCVRILY